MLLEILESTKASSACYCLSDAEKYMIAAGITLKSLYPKLFHVMCVAHSLHKCAMKIKSHVEDVDQLIAKVKAVTIKNKTRQAKFSAIDYPHQPVPTRWGSWLNAALCYTKNLLEVKRGTLFITAAFCCSAAQNFRRQTKCFVQYNLQAKILVIKNSTLLAGKAVSRFLIEKKKKIMAMNEINTKLDKIITKMDNIADWLSNVEASVATLQNSLSLIEDKFEDCCKKIEKNIDDKVTYVDLNEVIGRVNDLEQCSSHHNYKLENLTQKLSDFTHSINMNKQKIESNRIMQELYSKRLNLLIHDLKENERNELELRKETYALFTRFLQEALNLGLDSIQLADIHRLPQHTIFKNGK